MDKNPLEDDLQMMIKSLNRDVKTGLMKDRFWRLGLVYYKMIKNHINKNGLSSEFKRTYALLSTSDYDLKTEATDRATDLPLSIMIHFMQKNRIPAEVIPPLTFCKLMEDKIDLNDKVFLMHFIMGQPIKPFMKLIALEKFQVLAPSEKALKAMQNKRFKTNAGIGKLSKTLSQTLKKQIVEKVDKEMGKGKTQKQVAKELGLSDKYIRVISKEVQSLDQVINYTQIEKDYMNEHRKYDYPKWKSLKTMKYNAYFEDEHRFDDVIRLMLSKQIEAEGFDTIKKRVLFLDADRQAIDLYKTMKNLYELTTGKKVNDVTDKDKKEFMANFFEVGK